MPRFRPVGVAVALAAALTACSPAPAQAPPATQAPAPALSWTDCGDGFQCTTIEVPKDWNTPDGEKIALGMTKLPATGTRTGAVFVNWGGPGDPGTSSIRTRGQAIADATFALTNATACPLSKDDPLPLPTAPVAGSVLIMGNVSDAETPLENGEELRAMIPGARLIVLDTMGHTGFYRSQCLADAGGAALTRGELPADGTRCAA